MFASMFGFSEAQPTAPDVIEPTEEDLKNMDESDDKPHAVQSIEMPATVQEVMSLPPPQISSPMNPSVQYHMVMPPAPPGHYPMPMMHSPIPPGLAAGSAGYHHPYQTTASALPMPGPGLGMPQGYTPPIGGPMMAPQPVAATPEERIEQLRAENADLEQQLIDLKACQNEQDSQQVLASLRDGLKEADQNLRDLQDRALHTFQSLQMEIDTLRNQIQMKTNLAMQYEHELNLLSRHHAQAQVETQNISQATSAEISQLKAQNQSRDMKLADLKVQLDRVNNKMAANSLKRSARQSDANTRHPEFAPLQEGEPLFPYKCCYPEDEIDSRLAEIFNGVASHVKITRINKGLYKFAQLQCELAIINNKLLVKVEHMVENRAAWNHCKFGHFDRFLAYIENETYLKMDEEEDV